MYKRQVYIDQTEQALSAFDRQVERETQKTLSCLVRSKTKRNVLLLSQGPKAGQSQYTYAEIVNAAANYYKHRAEWDQDWITGASKQQLQTANVVMALGAKPEHDDNMSKLARNLGNHELFNVDEFLRGIEKWKFGLLRQIEEELQQQHLV